MPQKEYNLIFKGQVTDGNNISTVKARLQKLFKTTTEKVDRMFSGQPVILKHSLDTTTAEKYKKALFQAGALCELHPQQQPEASQKSQSQSPPKTPETTTHKADAPDWEILPSGSLLSESKSSQYITPDTTHLDISPQRGYIVEPDQSPAPPPPDTSHLALEPR